MIKKHENLMEKVVSLCKRRGFVFPGSEIYGGLANSWDYGHLGVELKNNIKNLWWRRFVQSREDMVGLDAALIMNPKTWEASGHLNEFTDPLVECKNCHTRFRVNEHWSDKVWWNLARYLAQETLSAQDRENMVQDTLKVCPNCVAEKKFTAPKNFNLMFKTYVGVAEGKADTVYLRPETAQAIFVDFKNILDTARKQLPFGVGQIGKAFRNEITPGNFIFRTREFEQMEVEYFVREKEWEKWFEHWRKEILAWALEIGLKAKNLHEYEHPDDARAHYSKKTIDFEYDFPFGRKELYGLAYRTDFDLKNHEKFSGKNLKYKDPDPPAGGEREFWPHVIEPSFGVDRSVLAVLVEAYDDSDPERIVLKLKPKLAPYKAAVFPLLKNKPELVKLARKIYDDLRVHFSTGGGSSFGGMVAWDDRGNIGKRYFSQDEIGTPYCITVDFETVESAGGRTPAGGTVTVRDRDTMKQERVKIDKLGEYLMGKLV
ncbi:MAG: glycine--tRNA ligase [bacterium]|nr:glycine--tRNA ligase [bacterium]